MQTNLQDLFDRMNSQNLDKVPRIQEPIYNYVPNPKQTICIAIMELEEVNKQNATDNNSKALELLKQALSLL